jgi:repressor LexA
MALTPRQKEVLDFLVAYLERHGFSPSFEEIAAGLNLSSLATVHKHISALEQKGYLRRRFNESRSIEVSQDYLEAERERLEARHGGQGKVPLLGRIAAGSPVESVAVPETLNLGEFADSENVYALQVKGDSMIEDHICSGDFVLVERVAEVRDGEIVVALVDGMETTLKRLYREPDGRIRLQPANAEMAPIYVEPERLEIQGRVLAVLRKFRGLAAAQRVG